MSRVTNARFSPCRRWRYRLWRRWDETLPHAAFLLMNPSTADELENDPTVERCELRVARPEWREGGMPKVGGVEVVNVFAWRETDSRKLLDVSYNHNIIGPENDQAIVDACMNAAIVVCGWGGTGHQLLNRGAMVMSMLRTHGIKTHAFKINADGSPKHPLYVGYATLPFEWRY